MATVASYVTVPETTAPWRKVWASVAIRSCADIGGPCVQELMAVGSSAWLVTSILRGLALSATGIARRSTPES